MRIACLVAALAAAAGPAAAEQRTVYVTTDPEPEAAPPTASGYEQAWLNYTAIVAGRRQLSELSRAELRDLLLLDWEIRAQQPDTRSPREKCFDSELARAGREPTEFALRAIDLKCSQR